MCLSSESLVHVRSCLLGEEAVTLKMSPASLSTADGSHLPASPLSGKQSFSGEMMQVLAYRNEMER